MGIAGELLEAELILRWLARFAEADLIRRDDAIAGLNERGDGGLPGVAAQKFFPCSSTATRPVGRAGFTSM